MKRIYGPKPNVGRRRAGDNFVALLFVIGIPLAGLVFWLTGRFLAPRDSLARFVPKEAVAYVHAGNPVAADALLSYSPSAPADIKPFEAATFALRAEDGTLAWTTLVAWHEFLPASDDEKRILGERGGIELNARAYVLGDAERSRAAERQGAGITSDEGKREALAVIRGLAAIQAYVDPTLFGDEPLPTLRLDGERPSVVGITATDGGILAVAMPVDVAARYRLTGFLTPERTHGAPPVRLSPETDIVIVEDRPAFDVATVLFGDVGRGLPRAEEALRPLNETPVATYLSANRAESGTGAALHFPHLSTSETGAALARFIASVWPERRAFLMPDEDTGVEHVYAEENVRVEPLVDGRLRHAARTIDSGIGLLYLSGDGGNGSYVATSLDLLIAAQTPTRRIPTCAFGNAKRILAVNNLEKLSGNPDFFARLSLKSAVVNEFGDNIVTLCGYSYPFVDN